MLEGGNSSGNTVFGGPESIGPKYLQNSVGDGPSTLILIPDQRRFITILVNLICIDSAENEVALLLAPLAFNLASIASNGRVAWADAGI